MDRLQPGDGRRPARNTMVRGARVAASAGRPEKRGHKLTCRVIGQMLRPPADTAPLAGHFLADSARLPGAGAYGVAA
jgi:hypothetical protein